MMAIPIPPEEMVNVWPNIRPYVEAALDRDPLQEYAPEDVLAMLLNAERVAILLGEGRTICGAAVMEITEFRGGKALSFQLCSGYDRNEWLEPLIETAEMLAEDSGCDLLLLKGRKGWERALREHGFAHYYSIMGREVKKDGR